MTELTPDYNATMERLAALSRNHLLFFRLEVGRLLLEDFFGGEAEAYQSQDPKKAGGSFYGFVESCGEELREIGLGEPVLRQCIQAHIAGCRAGGGRKMDRRRPQPGSAAGRTGGGGEDPAAWAGGEPL